MHEAKRTLTESRIRSVSRSLPAVPCLMFVLMLAYAPTGHSQTSNGNGNSQGSQGSQGSMHQSFPPRADLGSLNGDDYDPVMMDRRMRALNAERQKEMVSDANKLLKLARELNAEVASEKTDSLTSEQLHKIAEIEKLARSVKERMASAVGEGQSVLPSPQVVYPMH